MLALTFVLASVWAPPPAPTDDPSVPEGTAKKDPATTGSTELGGSGQFATAGAKPEESMDATELNLSLGGIFMTGNTRSVAVTGLGKFLIRRDIHQFTAGVAGNFGQSAIALRDDPATMDLDESDIRRNAANVQGQVRYEVFFHKHFSAFLMTTARYDEFQGLDLRLNVDPGIAMYAIVEEKHKLWFEVGYDFQVDVRDDEALRRAEVIEMEDLDRIRLNHAARLFAGYTNNLSKYVTFDTGLEYLQSFLIGRWFRFNWVNALSVQINNRFSLATTFTLRYDNLPLPGIQKLDTVTAVLLGLRLI
jgi:putative salt-induced outer membrane protein YdiY